MSNSTVQTFVARFMPLMEQNAVRLRKDYPDIDIRAWSSSTGGGTDYQGWDVGIECILPKGHPCEFDNIALTLGIKHITTAPTICEAEVLWNTDRGGEWCEASVIEQPVPFSEETLNRLQQNVPRLIEALKTGLDRKMPRTSKSTVRLRRP